MPTGRALQWPSGVSKKSSTDVGRCGLSSPSLVGGGAKKMLARMPGELGGPRECPQPLPHSLCPPLSIFNSCPYDDFSSGLYNAFLTYIL